MQDRKSLLKLLGTILGIGLLVALGFVMSGWFRAMKTAKESAPASSQPLPVSVPQESEEQTPPTPSAPQSPERLDPTADWRVYNDTELGFSIRYPAEWTVEVTNRHNTDLPENTITFQSKPPIMDITLAPVERKPDMSLTEFARHLNQTKLGVSSERELRLIYLNELEAARMVNYQPPIQGLPSVAFVSTIVVEDDQAYWFLTQFEADPKTGNPLTAEGRERLQTYEQMLQTFQLVR